MLILMQICQYTQNRSNSAGVNGTPNRPFATLFGNTYAQLTAMTTKVNT